MSEPKKEGLEDLENHEKSEERKVLIEKLSKEDTYAYRSATDVFNSNPEPPIEVWGGICLDNSLNEIIGASGIGKSRIVLNLAVRQCLASTKPERDENGELICEFAGLPLSRKPLKWLFIGTENTLYRYHKDLSKMMQDCTEEQREALDKHLFMMTLEGEDDTYIELNDEDVIGDCGNFHKIRVLLAKTLPDIVVFDPWGDLIGGSELDDFLARRTIAHIRKLKNGILDQMTVIVVNHSRMGLNETIRAVGLDAANFGKNSKKVYTIARCAWNLFYLEDDLASNLIGMSNPKTSLEKTYPARAIRLNEETMSYDWDPTVDVDECLLQLASRVSQPNQNRDEIRAKKKSEMTKKAIEKLKSCLKGDAQSKSYLSGILRNMGVGERSIEGILEILCNEHGYFCIENRLDSNKKYYGTPEAIAKLKADMEAKIAAAAAKDVARVPKKRGRPRKVENQ